MRKKQRKKYRNIKLNDSDSNLFVEEKDLKSIHYLYEIIDSIISKLYSKFTTANDMKNQCLFLQFLQFKSMTDEALRVYCIIKLMFAKICTRNGKNIAFKIYYYLRGKFSTQFSTIRLIEPFKNPKTRNIIFVCYRGVNYFSPADERAPKNLSLPTDFGQKSFNGSYDGYLDQVTGLM